ncbi:hypothetical protein FRC00_002326 [Tulasnella sp. 408]|nr:hypothetical protein FRC00_002326 [Tulasnella sp. 408]
MPAPAPVSSDSKNESGVTTTPAPQLAATSLGSLGKLPLEILMTVARFYTLLCKPNRRKPVVLPLTHVSRKVRQIIVGTPDFWASFAILDNEKSFHFARLCIERSMSYPLEVELCAYVSGEGSDLGDRCYDLLHPVASRIRNFKVYMASKDGLHIGKGILASLQMPTLEQIVLHYNSFRRAEPISSISLPGGGGNIQVLTLGGLHPISSNLTNLKSLTLKSSIYCEWPPAIISAIIAESPSLESLTFIDSESVFEVKDKLPPSFISSTSLRHLALKGGIAFELTSSLLLALHAPNLETVHIAEPCRRINAVGWGGIADQMEERFLRRKDTFEHVHSLVLDPWPDGVQARPRNDMHFFRFLMIAFPNITSLDLDQKDVCVLSISNGENELLRPGWAFIDRLTVHDNPSHHALERVLAFVDFRDRNGRDHVEGDEEEVEDDDNGEESDGTIGKEDPHRSQEGDGDVRNQDHDTTQEGDDDVGNQDHTTENDQASEGRNAAQLIASLSGRLWENARQAGRRKANEALKAWAEERGDFECTPIETVVIKIRGKTKAEVNKVIDRLRERVKSVQVLEALGPA